MKHWHDHPVGKSILSGELDPMRDWSAQHWRIFVLSDQVGELERLAPSLEKCLETHKIGKVMSADIAQGGSGRAAIECVLADDLFGLGILVRCLRDLQVSAGCHLSYFDVKRPTRMLVQLLTPDLDGYHRLHGGMCQVGQPFKLMQGDVLAVKFEPSKFRLARIVSVDRRLSARSVLVYVYRNEVRDISSVEHYLSLRRTDLLLPPLLVARPVFRSGIFRLLHRGRLSDDDIWEEHRFSEDWTCGVSIDEFGGTRVDDVLLSGGYCGGQFDADCFSPGTPCGTFELGNLLRQSVGLPLDCSVME